MIGVTIETIITSDTALIALIGDRVYPLVYPSKPVFPCITYRVISGYNEPVISEQVNTTRVQLDVWSYGYLTTGAVKTELMRLFNHYSGTANGQVIIHAYTDLAFDTFEQNIKAHRAVIDLRITHEGS